MFTLSASFVARLWRVTSLIN